MQHQGVAQRGHAEQDAAPLQPRGAARRADEQRRQAQQQAGEGNAESVARAGAADSRSAHGAARRRSIRCERLYGQSLQPSASQGHAALMQRAAGQASCSEKEGASRLAGAAITPQMSPNATWRPPAGSSPLGRKAPQHRHKPGAQSASCLAGQHNLRSARRGVRFNSPLAFEGPGGPARVRGHADGTRRMPPQPAVRCC